MLELSEFRVLDRNSDYYGTPVSKLMDNAGMKIADFALSKIGTRKSILIVCGPGNNGGDGFAAAVNLRGKVRVLIKLVGIRRETMGELAASRFGNVWDLAAPESAVSELSPADTVVIDALFGSGINRPPEGDFLSAVRFMDGMREKGSILISVDVPSGFPTGIHVHPDFTLTFHDTKKGMSKENCGEIVVADIGIPEMAVRYTGPGEVILYPVPARESHKGRNGIVTVVGGGAFSGAPAFSSLAAYRAGADLVYTIVPVRSYETVAGFSPNLMVFPSKGERFSRADEETVTRWAQRSGALVIGPGMDGDGDTIAFISRILQNTPCPVVADAAAIDAIGRNRSLAGGKNFVVTPHSKEFEKLTGESVEKSLESRAEQIRQWARKLGATILLKGATDVISDGQRVKLNDTGNPGMTVGGTGDVLTGIVACLLSKGCSTFDAARLGAYINGSAGDLSFATKSYGLLATDVIESIPDVLVRDIRERR